MCSWKKNSTYLLLLNKMFYKNKHHQILFNDGVLVQIFSNFTEFWMLLVISITKREFFKVPSYNYVTLCTFSRFCHCFMTFKFYFKVLTHFCMSLDELTFLALKWIFLNSDTISLSRLDTKVTQGPFEKY